MKKRKAITEITTVASTGKSPVYLSFVDDEMVQNVIVKEKDVTATFKITEGNVEVGNCRTVRENENVVLNGVKTACLIIDTTQETEFEVITIK